MHTPNSSDVYGHNTKLQLLLLWWKWWENICLNGVKGLDFNWAFCKGGSFCVKLFLTESCHQRSFSFPENLVSVCVEKKGRVLMNLITDRQTGRGLSRWVEKALPGWIIIQSCRTPPPLAASGKNRGSHSQRNREIDRQEERDEEN